MITAIFKWKKLVIDLLWIDQKYKKKWEKIIFTLFYWSEYIWTNWNWNSIDSYKVVWKKEIYYSWIETFFIELDEIKDWYRWKDIFIWYYLEINFWKKFFVFKDSKNINIDWRENLVYNYNNLQITSNEFFNKVDNYSYKRILWNLTITRKIILLSTILLILGWFLVLILTSYNTELLIVLSIVVAVITFFTSWKDYIKCELKKNIYEGDLISSVISWKIKLDLDELNIQLFALNSEKWNYEINNWSTKSTVRFNTHIWDILLYKTQLKYIKAGTNLENYIKWKLDFSEIYENLFPSIEITNKIWLFISLELRIKSKNYKDLTYRQDLHISKHKFLKTI